MKKLMLFACLLCLMAAATSAFAGGPMPLCYPLACCGDSFTPLCMPPDCDPNGCSAKGAAPTIVAALTNFDGTDPMPLCRKNCNPPPVEPVPTPTPNVTAGDYKMAALLENIDSKTIFNRRTGLYCQDLPAGTCGWCRTSSGSGPMWVCMPGLHLGE